jgi:hypothetical protein
MWLYSPNNNRIPQPQLSDYAITLPNHRHAVKDYFPTICNYPSSHHPAQASFHHSNMLKFN